MGVRSGNNLRLFGEIEPRDGIEGVKVDPHDHFQISGGKGWDAHERIHRTFAEFLPRFDVCGLLPRYVH